MVEIPLSKGYVALVDDADADRVNAHKWTASVHPGDRVYAIRRERIAVNQFRCLLLHRVVLGLPPGRSPQVDHINGDGLDNRRSNLRPATQSQNNANKGPLPGSSSQYKGVSWNKAKKLWTAQIKIHSKIKRLGYFRDEQVAARAYDVAAVELFGEFARPNGAFSKW